MSSQYTNAIEGILLCEFQEIDSTLRHAGIDPTASKSPAQYEYGQIAEKWPILHEDLEAGRDIQVPYGIIRANLNRLWELVEGLKV